MEKLINLFEEFIMKAITMTEEMLAQDFTEREINFDHFTDNRERLFNVIEKISEQINWDEIAIEKRAELNRQIEFIKKLDERLLTKLQEHREEIRSEIERTVRQKDNIKGYNLSDVK